MRPANDDGSRPVLRLDHRPSIELVVYRSPDSQSASVDVSAMLAAPFDIEHRLNIGFSDFGVSARSDCRVGPGREPQARRRARLTAARRQANVTQQESAARLGNLQSFASEYERGQRRIDVVELLVIARVLVPIHSACLRGSSILPAQSEAIASSLRDAEGAGRDRRVRTVSRCLLDVPFTCFQGLGQQRFEQTAAGVLASGEARLQPVAQRHQFIDLGNDAVLLCEGWNRQGEIVYQS